jgi:uncharacterized membrane protein YjgN (DUF898 family)
MTEQRYHVVYRGNLREGFEFETAQHNLSRIFNLPDHKAEKILKARKVILRKNMDQTAARTFAAVIKRAGIDVDIVEAQAGAGKQAKILSVPPASPPEKSPPAPPEASSSGPPAPAKPPGPIALRFQGTGSDYFRIWIVNIILSVLTLGIYSAWAKVRRKQYFYGNTRIQDASFEYLADPKKILYGRVIVVVGFIAYSAVSELLPIIGSILGLAFIFILPWLVVKSLAFNARNSSIRNIRFDFTGTVRQAAVEYVLWPFLAVLTLGILSAYVYYRQKKFLVENSRYGTARFSFTAAPRDYYRIFLSALVPILIGILAAAGAGFLFPPVSALVILVLYLYLFAFFSVKTTNLLYNSSRLGPHRMEADLKINEYLVLVLVNSLATALTLGLFHPWAKVRIYRYKIGRLTLIPGASLDEFVAAEKQQVSAIGEEAGDFFDFDIGL